ncbi:hypothetical protein WS68_04660 [Burkholderia sp. TSV86]|nr:hypothetical protein WS68_04660 [Burkholderia sp. TSV86]
MKSGCPFPLCRTPRNRAAETAAALVVRRADMTATDTRCRHARVSTYDATATLPTSAHAPHAGCRPARHPAMTTARTRCRSIDKPRPKYEGPFVANGPSRAA